MNEVKLTVAIITFNEESNIKRCIDSIKAIADQILVLDSFSNDKTESICLSLENIDFVQNEFKGHIEQKNKALELSKYDYVLSIDADEAIDENAVAEILKVKSDWKYSGYSFNRLNRYCGKWIKHSGWYPDKKLRLVDRTKCKWIGTNPHDKLNTEDGNILHLKGHILHYTIDTQNEHLRQINYFTDVSSTALYKKGKRVSILKIITSPIFKFIRDYILKFGFLDGFEGFVIASNSAHAKFQKYVKLYYLNKRGK